MKSVKQRLEHALLREDSGGDITRDFATMARKVLALYTAAERAAGHFGWLYDEGALTREEGPLINALKAAIRGMEEPTP